MKNIFMAALACASLSILLTAPAQAQGPAPTPAHMKWWRDARFGMFIHWGPVSIRGTEISWSRNPNPYGPNASGIPAAEYDSLYKRFDPVKFNAPRIAAVAKAAGMKYIVLVAKHHDGFCEFDSKYTDYKITSPESPYRKDIVQQMADACHKAGLHFCVYYSQPDLHNPYQPFDKLRQTTIDQPKKNQGQLLNQPAYIKYFHNQVHELLTGYGKVDLIWFDGIGLNADAWDAPALFAQMRTDNPNLIINNRCGLPGDYYTPEQTIGSYDDQRPWETCMTIGDQWSYKPDDRYKSSVQCIQTLARCVGGDGNLLLNIGPQPDGAVNPTQADRLHDIAAWMKTHSSAIYGTRGGPYTPTSSYVSTRKGSTVYVHVLKWVGDSVTLPPLPKRIVAASLVGGGRAAFKQSADEVTVTVPAASHDPADTVIALRLAGTAMQIAPIKSPLLAGGSIPVRVSASNVFQRDATYDASKAFDDDPGTRWATDGGTKQAWLQADFLKPEKISSVKIQEAIASRVQRFELEYTAPGSPNWITLKEGTTLSPDYKASFPPVVMSAFRLNILDATDGPTIAEVSFQTLNEKNGRAAIERS